MNEIKKVHLGHQPFTIAVDAHRSLRTYLDAIGQQVGPKDEEVLKEIELRMAELLTERGFTTEKVVLIEDVDFLKEQLGKPRDFKDEVSGESAGPTEEKQQPEPVEELPRRLFRDPEQAMVAGVASGLAAYFRVDPLIMRLIFIVLALSGGAGLLLYILLWLLVPEAKTPSDRLQMRGKAVTVDNIKQLVDRADVPAAANRAGTVVGRAIVAVFKVCLTLLGAGVVAAGSAVLLGVLFTGTYLLIHGGQVGTEITFPIGSREVLFIGVGMVAGIAFALFLVALGVSMIRRIWTVPAWATATIVSLFFIASTTTAALGFDIFPVVRQRYHDAHTTQTRTLSTFKAVELSGQDVYYSFKPADTYSVTLSYLGKVTEHNVRTEVTGTTLKIDATTFMEEPLCNGICLYSDHDLKVTIHAPSLDRVTITGGDALFAADAALQQQNIVIEAAQESMVRLAYVNPEALRLSMDAYDDTARLIELSGIRSEDATRSDRVYINEETAYITRAEHMHLTTSTRCDEAGAMVYVQNEPKELYINDREVLKSAHELTKLRSMDALSAYNCVVIH